MAIAFVQDKFKVNTTSASTIVITITTTTGNCLIASVAINATTQSVSSITDTASNTWTKVNRVTNSDAIEQWRTGASSTGVTSVTVNLSAATTATGIISEYSGVHAIGANTTNTGSSTNPTVSLTTTGGSSAWSVASFIRVGSNAGTAQTGNLREDRANGTAFSDYLMDNTSASPVTTSFTTGGAAKAWAVSAVELDPPSGGGPTNSNQLMLTGAGT